jgi:hypothetical protein
MDDAADLPTVLAQAETEEKKDFRNWSGGFPPESEEQITVYLDYAAAADADPEDLRGILREWMEQES